MATLVALKTAGAVLALNYGAHVGSAYAYGSVCVPHGLWDVVQSFVTTASPVCACLLNTMQVTQNNFAVVVTTTLASLLAGVMKA